VNETVTNSQDSAIVFNGDKKKEKGKSQGKKEDVEEKKGERKCGRKTKQSKER